MREAGWYVVQVQSGREEQVRRVIERACAEVDVVSDSDERLLDECFCPRYQTQTKVRGEWCYVERNFQMRISRPSLPMRLCRNIGPPGLSSEIAAPRTTPGTSMTTSTPALKQISNVRLTN